MFLKKLINGDYGLLKTFWIFGVLIQLPIYALIMTFSYAKLLVAAHLTLFVSISLLYFVYSIIVTIALFAAARKYEGHKIWLILLFPILIFRIFGHVVNAISFADFIH